MIETVSRYSDDVALVRAQSYDRFLSASIAPQAQQDVLFTLYRFMYEIDKIPQVTSEEMLGMIRTQWWREAIDEIYDENKTVRQHDVCQLLSNRVETGAIPHAMRTRFEAVIAGCEHLLHQTHIADIADLHATAAQHYGSQFRLIASALDDQSADDDAVGQVIDALASSYMIVQLLRYAYTDLPKRACPIPQTMWKQVGTNEDHLGTEKFLTAFAEIVTHLVAEGEAQLMRAQKLQRKLPRDIRKSYAPIWAHGTICRKVYGAIKRQKYDVLTQKVPELSGSVILPLLWKKWCKGL